MYDHSKTLKLRQLLNRSFIINTKKYRRNNYQKLKNKNILTK